jgi:hypothetical protein
LTTTGDLYACESQTNFDTIINRQQGGWEVGLLCGSTRVLLVNFVMLARFADVLAYANPNGVVKWNAAFKLIAHC